MILTAFNGPDVLNESSFTILLRAGLVRGQENARFPSKVYTWKAFRRARNKEKQ